MIPKVILLKSNYTIASRYNIPMTYRYIAFYKPYEVLCTFTDSEGRATLKEFIKVPDIYVAGRLDRDSEGLLLLTDDGDLAHRLTEPRFFHTKVYWVQVEGQITPQALEELTRGVLVKGYRTRRCQADIIPEPDLPPRSRPVTPHAPTSWIQITLTEGKKRQVRHMTAAVGFPTLRLVRVAIGTVQLGSLKPGDWRWLSTQEVSLLKGIK